MQKIVQALLFVGLGLCLLQVWTPAYYITGDGPCHLYNAQVLHDLWCHQNTDFYTRYYSVSTHPDPNWLSTIALSLLLYIFNGIVAEKILLSLYVLVFVSGFYSLLKKISGGTSYWLLALFLFVFPHELAKGFYNSTFGIAFYFWAIWGWLRFLEKRSIVSSLVFLALTALTYFTHLLAFGFEAFTCAALVVSYTLAENKGKPAKYFIAYAGWLGLFLAPFLLLMLMFTRQQGGLQLSLGHHFHRLVELAQLKYMVNITAGEDVFALAAGVTILSLFSYVLIRYKIRTGLHKYDGFLLALTLAGFVYLFFPESFLGRLILINMRVQPIVAALVVCCIAYFPGGQKIKNAGALILFTCFICLTLLRIQCLITASKAVTDYGSPCNSIKPHSIVLPLDFSPAGKDEQGCIIASRNYLFSHAADYMGLKKPLIMLDNYEANMGYFPLLWNEQLNPYHHLDRAEGIEGLPPSASISAYKRYSGVTIDYIIMWCYDAAFLENQHFRALYNEIQAGYHMVYTSPTGRTILYEANVH